MQVGVDRVAVLSLARELIRSALLWLTINGSKITKV